MPAAPVIATGQLTYDMFNKPLYNSLAGTIDPVTGTGCLPDFSAGRPHARKAATATQNGIVGMIVTCPKYESDGKTLSPLGWPGSDREPYPGRYGVMANPGADRIGRGEEWLQTNTLDGQKAHDSSCESASPATSRNLDRPDITSPSASPIRRSSTIAARPCAAQTQALTALHEVKGHVTTARMSRTPDERLYGSGTHDAYAFTQCYVSLGDPDGEDFAFTKCDADGNFDFRTSRRQLEDHNV